MKILSKIKCLLGFHQWEPDGFYPDFNTARGRHLLDWLFDDKNYNHRCVRCGKEKTIPTTRAEK